MKIRLLLSLAGLAFGFALPSFAQQKDTVDPEVAQQIRALAKKYDEAFSKNDAAALSGLFTEDAVQVAPEGVFYGRQAIEKRYADNVFQQWHCNNHVQQIGQVIAVGNEAVWVGEWSASCGGNQVHGSISNVAVREGHAWKVRISTFNVTPPSPPAQTNASPTATQQTTAPDPQLREQFVAFGKKVDEAWNNNDPAALAALYLDDAVVVRDTGPLYGRKAIENWFTDLLKQVQFSNHLATVDQNSPHSIGTSGNEIWGNGQWSQTVQGQNFGPLEQKGYFSCILVREGDDWKFRVETWNITPAPAATPSTTASPSSQ